MILLEAGTLLVAIEISSIQGQINLVYRVDLMFLGGC